MWINFLWALVPIIWLIISLGIIGMPASRACTIGLIITIADAVLMFKQLLTIPHIKLLFLIFRARLETHLSIMKRFNSMLAMAI